jgi:hypothetical protein
MTPNGVYYIAEIFVQPEKRSLNGWRNLCNKDNNPQCPSFEEARERIKKEINGKEVPWRITKYEYTSQLVDTWTEAKLRENSRWIVDPCHDANECWTIRFDDGSTNGDTDSQPIATIYDRHVADLIVNQHNNAIKGD